ncbi:hypothetical protein GE09DRAFT_1238460 [Coniochaeta sp. 2T2.1]|nr:hypothetical protein GE09DRAFT_1238460 [Coniochaeta sp. 2T2.1]
MDQLRAYAILDRRRRERCGVPPIPSDNDDEDNDDDDYCVDEEEEEKDSDYYEFLLYYQRRRRFASYSEPAGIASSLAEPKLQVNRQSEAATTETRPVRQWPSSRVSSRISSLPLARCFVMDEDEFGLWAGLYGNLDSKRYEREAHWDVKHPAKARHILETYFLDAGAIEALWDDLSWFWPSNCVQDWRVAATASLHTTTNLVPIYLSLLPAWAHAEIAFRPLSDDGRRDMYLQFYDLSPQGSEDEILEYNLRPTVVRVLFDYRKEDPINQPVRSGDIVHLHTNDKDRYPLPDFRLFKLQWHLNRAWCAAVSPRLLRILFDDNGYNDSAERDGYRSATAKYDPCPSHTPWFTHLLIDCAVEENIFSSKDVPVWKARLDPDGGIRDGGPGWIHFDFGEWKYLADPSSFTEWEYVEGYDDHGNRVSQQQRGHSGEEAE